MEVPQWGHQNNVGKNKTGITSTAISLALLENSQNTQRGTTSYYPSWKDRQPPAHTHTQGLTPHTATSYSHIYQEQRPELGTSTTQISHSIDTHVQRRVNSSCLTRFKLTENAPEQSREYLLDLQKMRKHTRKTPGRKQFLTKTANVEAAPSFLLFLPLYRLPSFMQYYVFFMIC